MAYTGVIDDFQALRTGRKPKRVPCVGHSEEFDVKWHGKYEYEDFCQDGDKIFEVYKSAIERFDYDWAWVQIDDCFEFEPIGVGVKGEGNILRATYKYLPVSRETLINLPTMDPGKDGRMPEKLKAIKKLRQYFGETVLITGSCAAPFSAIVLMWSIGESMMMMLTDAELLHNAMEYWLEFYKRYIKAQRDAGAHAIWLGDCNAFSSMVSVDQYKEHIFPVTQKLIRYCEDELDIMMWMHNSEILKEHVLSHLPLELSFESVGPGADMCEIMEIANGRCAISGNLDPIEVLWRGTPEQIEKDVERLMLICKPYGQYIFAPGEMNPRQVPEENMDAMMKTAKRLSDY